MPRKKTTPEDDWDRMAENLYTNLGNTITDRESFDEAFNEYFEVALIPKRGKKKVKDPCWAAYNKKYIKPRTIEFVETKSMKKDRMKKQKKVAAQRKKKREAPKLIEHDFNYIGTINNPRTNGKRQVYARQIMTKRGIRYIDQRGRYVSIKRPRRAEFVNINK